MSGQRRGRWTVRLSGVEVDVGTGVFSGAGRQGRLSPRERQVLAYLAERAPAVVPRVELLQALWNTDDPRSRAVDAAWSRLRRKLERDPASPRHLLTIHGDGYRLDLGVAAPEVAPAPLGEVEDPDLVGREAVLEQARGWLTDGGPWLTLWGPGGVGKTRLARTLAEHWRSGGGRVVWVALEAATTADEAVHGLAGALGVAPRAGVPVVDEVVRAARGAPALWILDNLEQLGAEARELVALAGACDGVRVLATSRSPVRDLREAVLPVEALDREASRTLLERRLGDATCPPSDLEALLEAAGGLPLALELTAAGLRHGAEEPTTRPVTAHPTLRQVVDRSADRLPARTREVLVRLVVVDGLIDEDAAAAVADATPTDLDRLVEASLLQRDDDGLRLHPVVRAWATDALARTDPEGRTRTRWRRWVLARAEPLGRALHGTDPAPAMARARRLAPALQRLLVATRPGHHHTLLPALPLLRRLVPAERDALRWLDRLGQAAVLARRTGEPDVADRLDLLACLAGDRVLPSDEREARLARIAPSDDPRMAQAIGLARAILERERGQVEAALARLAEVRRGPDPELSVRATLVEGVALRLGPPEERAEVIRALAAALARVEAMGDALLEAEVAREVGAAHFVGADYAAAEPLLRRAASTWQAVGDARGTARALQVLCSTAMHRGDLARAEACARSGLEAAPPGSPLEAVLHLRLGVCLRRRGDLDGAVAHLALAADRLDGVDQEQAAMAWSSLAAARMARGELDEALAAVDAEARAARATGRADLVRHAALTRVDLLLRRRRVAEALEVVDTLVGHEHTDGLVHASARSTRAEVLARLGRRDEALREIAWVAAWAREREHVQLTRHSLLNLALLDAARGDAEAARQALAATRPLHRLQADQVAVILERLDLADLDGWLGQDCPDATALLARRLAERRDVR